MDVSEDTWEPFFDLMEKIALQDDVNELVVPALGILASVWAAKPELCESSGIFDSESIKELDLGRLLRAQKYDEYTSFIVAGISERFSHHRNRFDKLDD